MGCVESLENRVYIIIMENAYIFAVKNVDENGKVLSGGLMEVTMFEILLHRRGYRPTVWPFSTLRRCSNDTADLFTIESGHQASTGEGLFWFRCNRAQKLYRLLCNNIRQMNTARKPAGMPANLLLALTRHPLAPNEEERTSVDVRCSNGTPEPEPVEATPTFYSTRRPANWYLIPEAVSLEQNQNIDGYLAKIRQLFGEDFNRDLGILKKAKLRNTAQMQLKYYRKIEKEWRFIKNLKKMQKEKENLIIKKNQEKKQNSRSPTHSDDSGEDYAQLSIRPDLTRRYMNVGPDQDDAYAAGPSSRPTPSLYVNPAAHLYENVDLPEHDTSMRPTAVGLNYAVLDLDRNREESVDRSAKSQRPQGSASQGPQSRRPASGSSAVQVAGPSQEYSTIDFESTRALGVLTSATELSYKEGSKSSTRHVSPPADPKKKRN